MKKPQLGLFLAVSCPFPQPLYNRVKLPRLPNAAPVIQLDSLGARLAQAAARLGGKRALAQATGISEAQIFRYANGECEIPAHRLLAVAQACGVTLDWLLTGAGNAQASPRQQRPAFRPGLLQHLSQTLDEVLVEYPQRIPLRQKSRFLAFMYEAARHEEIRSEQLWQGGRGLMVNSLDFLCGLGDEESLQLYERFAYHQMFGEGEALKSNEQDSLGQAITQAISHYFNGISGEAIYRRLTLKVRTATAQRLQNMVAESRQALGLAAHKPLSILDLGCGNGRDLLFLHRLDANLQLKGLELSERGVKLAQNLEKATQLPANTIIMGDAQLMPFANASFDIISSRSSLLLLPVLHAESTNGWHAILRECHRVLKPGGRFYLMTASGKGEVFLPFIQLLDKEQIEKLANRNGFEISFYQTHNQAAEQAANGVNNTHLPSWVVHQVECILIKK